MTFRDGADESVSMGALQQSRETVARRRDDGRRERLLHALK